MNTNPEYLDVLFLISGFIVLVLGRDNLMRGAGAILVLSAFGPSWLGLLVLGILLGVVCTNVFVKQSDGNADETEAERAMAKDRAATDEELERNARLLLRGGADAEQLREIQSKLGFEPTATEPEPQAKPAASSSSDSSSSSQSTEPAAGSSS